VDTWMAQWQSLGLSEAAQIAFRWAQFPPEQEYAVGEWNQGMLLNHRGIGTIGTTLEPWNYRVHGKTGEKI